jgi:hypothetical protein
MTRAHDDGVARTIDEMRSEISSAEATASHDVHARMCANLVGRLFTTPEGYARDVEGVDAEGMSYCWRYGYYLRACEMSLPDEARNELA